MNVWYSVEMGSSTDSRGRIAVGSTPTHDEVMLEGKRLMRCDGEKRIRIK